MTIQVFWPLDLFWPKALSGKNALVLGVSRNSGAFVVINIVTYNDIEELVTSGTLRQRTRGTLTLATKSADVNVIGFVGCLPDRLRLPDLLHFEIKDDGALSNALSQIILFDPPPTNSMQFYTLTPITISLSETCGFHPDSDLVQLIKQHGSVRPLDPAEEHLSSSIDSLNSCWTERRQLLRDVPNMQRFWESKSILSTFGQRAHSLWSNFLTFYLAVVLKPATTILMYSAIALRHICLYMITLLNSKIADGLPSLIDLSATAQQIDLRLQQFCYFPVQYIRTTRLAESDHTGTILLPKEQYPEYIRFYNTLWLIVNDFTIGVMIGSALIENQNQIAAFFDQYIVQRVLYSELNNISVWLMNSPGGIKLNNELSMFMSDLFRWILEFWRISLIEPIAPHYGKIVGLIGWCSIFGATFSIALFSDFLSIITFHISCFYVASARIYNWQLNVLISLFRLFCGKKINVLRNRVDSNDYELDQLLMGTLLFTVNLFLLPTVLAFYVMFSITELIILMITGCLEVFMTLLNHFPLFILLLRIKNYKRVPGGIRLTHEQGMVSVKIKPLSVPEMFAPFTNVIQKMKASYISAATMRGVLAGHTVKVQRNKLYKLLYSALPSTRISTKHLLSEIQKTL